MSKSRLVTVNIFETPESEDPLYRDLRLYIGSGSLERVTMLLDSGAGVNSRDTNGLTPLMWAAVSGKTAMMRLLIERGANIHMACSKGKTALMRAASNGGTEAVQLLVEHGADVNAATAHGLTALDFTRGALQPEGAVLALRQAGAVERVNKTEIGHQET